MFKRAYAVALRPGLDQHIVDEMVHVLQDAPRFIPGMAYSIVRPALGASPYDLIWDNAFVSRTYYENYLSHPYHCNVIDHYMYRESPAAAIGDGLCLRWEDQTAPSGAVAVVTDLDPAPGVEVTPGAVGAEAAPSAAGAEVAPGPAALPSVDPGQGPLYLVEHVDVQPGRTQEYLDALATEYRPMAARHGIEQVLCLRSPEQSGEEEIVLVWKLANWAAYVDFRAFFQFENEPASTEWVARITALRISGRRRLMLAAGLDAICSG